jgi:hypothetical protein
MLDGGMPMDARKQADNLLDDALRASANAHTKITISHANILTVLSKGRLVKQEEEELLQSLAVDVVLDDEATTHELTEERKFRILGVERLVLLEA